MSEKNIVRYSHDKLPEGRTDWERIDAMTEEEIEANARSDPDNPPWTDEELQNAAVVYPDGRRYVPVQIYLDADVLDALRDEEHDYRDRIQAILRSYVHNRKERQSKKSA